jgi:hypothetical protein
MYGPNPPAQTILDRSNIAAKIEKENIRGKVKKYA